MPDCVVVIYNHEYKLNVVAEEMIEVSYLFRIIVFRIRKPM